MYFHDMNEISYKQKRDGVQIRGVSGDQVQMVFVKLEPGFAADHSHPQEQIGYVISGDIEITVGCETRHCGPGCCYAIPSNLSHSFRVLSDRPAEILDIFSPPKEENGL